MTSHHAKSSVRRQSGVTILELSVVLAIIALLIGGVLTGQKVIENAERRSVIIDLQSFKVATDQFFSIYKSYPGVFSKASSYWPGATNGTLVASGAPSTGVSYIASDGNYYLAWQVEGLLFWNHLGLAGLIPQQYSGGGAGVFPGINAPTSRMGGGYDANDEYIEIGAPDANPNNPLIDPILSALDAQFIDTKMDDGIPTSGVLHEDPSLPISPAATPPCTNGINYNIAETGLNCRASYYYQLNSLSTLPGQ